MPKVSLTRRFIIEQLHEILGNASPKLIQALQHLDNVDNHETFEQIIKNPSSEVSKRFWSVVAKILTDQKQRQELLALQEAILTNLEQTIQQAAIIEANETAGNNFGLKEIDTRDYFENKENNEQEKSLLLNDSEEPSPTAAFQKTVAKTQQAINSYVEKSKSLAKAYRQIAVTDQATLDRLSKDCLEQHQNTKEVATNLANTADTLINEISSSSLDVSEKRKQIAELEQDKEQFAKAIELVDDNIKEHHAQLERYKDPATNPREMYLRSLQQYEESQNSLAPTNNTPNQTNNQQSASTPKPPAPAPSSSKSTADEPPIKADLAKVARVRQQLAVHKNQVNESNKGFSLQSIHQELNALKSVETLQAQIAQIKNPKLAAMAKNLEQPFANQIRKSTQQTNKQNEQATAQNKAVINELNATQPTNKSSATPSTKENQTSTMQNSQTADTNNNQNVSTTTNTTPTIRR